MIEKIKKILQSSFEKELFEATLKNLENTENKLSYNNFAYSIRELSSIFLDTLSPKEKLKACSWYTPNVRICNNCRATTEFPDPPRSHKIRYAIQGGLSDELLGNIGFDVEELKEIIRQTKKAIDSLNKYTHIRESSFNLSQEETVTKSNEILTRFVEFIETIDNYREDLKSLLRGKIDEHVLNETIFHSFSEVDLLAPHHSIDYSILEDYYIYEITDGYIIVNVEGNLHVTLEYGSKAERREGDGVDLQESFPFSCTFKYKITHTFPSETYQVEDMIVDTDSWYS